MLSEQQEQALEQIRIVLREARSLERMANMVIIGCVVFIMWCGLQIVLMGWAL